MHHRDVLGPADISNEQLTELVAALVGEPPERVTLLDSDGEHVAYDLTSITTAGRYWVRGHALVGGRRRPFAFFVKHVQSFARSPLFVQVPAHLAAQAEATVPWRTEPLAYRSDLGDRLPGGLRMPRVFGVFDLDDKSAAIWLEQITAVPGPWDTARYARAAYLLGRLAASPRVRVRADVGEFGWIVCNYLQGRLTHMVIPMLRDPGIWQHPLTAQAFDDSLRARLQAGADRAPDLVQELADLPLGTIHGDACPNNLLVTTDDDGFVLIDYAFFAEGPIGFDLGQLLVGDVQIGHRPACTLQAIEDTIVPAYVQGLHAEGCTIPLDVVRRAHALQLMVFTGLSTLPFEHLAIPPTATLHHIAADRASIARFSLDLLDQTQTHPTR